MANVLFIKTLSKLLSDTPFRKDHHRPLAALGIKHGLNIVAQKVGRDEISLVPSDIFVMHTGHSILAHLYLLRKVCSDKEYTPFSAFYDEVFSFPVEEEITGRSKLKLIYMEDIDKIIEVCSKYPDDTYFIPSFLITPGCAGRTFKDRMDLFGYASALASIEGIMSPWHGVLRGMLNNMALSSLLDLRREVDSMIRDYIIGTTQSLEAVLANDVSLRGSLIDFVRKIKKWEEKGGKGIKLTSEDRTLLATSLNKEYKLYELKTMSALQQETAEIGHCVGRSETYFKRIENELSVIFSLKHLNKAVATIEYAPATYNMVQCKGYKNAPVLDEHLEVLVSLLDKASIYVNRVLESKVSSEFKEKLSNFVGPSQKSDTLGNPMYWERDLAGGVDRVVVDPWWPLRDHQAQEVPLNAEPNTRISIQGYAVTVDTISTEVRLSVELSETELTRWREIELRLRSLVTTDIVDAGVRLIEAYLPSIYNVDRRVVIDLRFRVDLEAFQQYAGAFREDTFLRVASNFVGFPLVKARHGYNQDLVDDRRMNQV